ncbi:hypothetical protein HDV04_005998 [Boothiomyces sp. JEL0838]|nr:hypothetical protein HDV04_005998 [Boothiomyces sp. JEL0838]
MKIGYSLGSFVIGSFIPKIQTLKVDSDLMQKVKEMENNDYIFQKANAQVFKFAIMYRDGFADKVHTKLSQLIDCGDIYRHGYHNIYEYAVSIGMLNPEEKLQEFKDSLEGKYALLYYGLKHGKLSPLAEYKPLRIACMYDDLDLVKSLLNQNAIPENEPRLSKDMNYQNVFRVVLYYENHEILQLILNDGRINPAQHSNLAIKYAINWGRLEMVKLLLKDDRVNPWDLNHLNLVNAARQGWLEIVELLLKHKCATPNVNDCAAVWFAVANGHLEVAETLLKDKRINPDAGIIWTAKDGQYKLMELLLKDERCDCSSSYRHIFRDVAKTGDLELVKLLLTDERVDISSACYANVGVWHNVELMDILLKDKRIDLEYFKDMVNNFAVKGNAEMVGLLLKDGRFDPNCYYYMNENTRNETLDAEDENIPIVNAAARGHLEVVKLLLQDSRVDPSAHENKAIITAANNGHFNVVKLLLQDDRVAKLYPPVHYKIDGKNSEILKYLDDFMAKH